MRSVNGSNVWMRQKMEMRVAMLLFTATTTSSIFTSSSFSSTMRVINQFISVWLDGIIDGLAYPHRQWLTLGWNTQQSSEGKALVILNKVSE